MVTNQIVISDKIELWSLDALIPYERNSRTHSDDQIRQIAASIEEFGFTNPILIDGDSGIIAGHGRLLAARQIGMEKVPVVILDHLTPTQRRAYVIADNKLALNAGWDDDILAAELAALELEDFDVELLGFSDEELGDLLSDDEDETEGLTDPDETPEAPENPVTAEGDVWLLGRHRLMCGDSTSIEAVERLMDGRSADFCFTSPPYNSAISKGHKSDRLGGTGFYNGGYSDGRTSDEYIEFNRQIFAAMAAVAADRFSCCYNINYNKNSPSEYLDVAISGREYFPLVETIGWEKAMAISLQGNNFTRIFEFIFVYAKGDLKMNKGQTDCERNLWKVNNIGANHDTHKACFPVELVERGVSLFAPDDGAVFEPFGGSGSTIIACEKTCRDGFMMELDPKYCDVSINRWQDFTGKQATLESTGQTFDEVRAERHG
jgi:DNA modification methylase